MRLCQYKMVPIFITVYDVSNILKPCYSTIEFKGERRL